MKLKLDSKGTIATNGDYSIVANDRINSGFQKPEATKLRYKHPLLGACLVDIISSKFNKVEIRYFTLQGEPIRLEHGKSQYLEINNQLSLRKRAPLRWFEYDLSDLEIDQPWFADIIQQVECLRRSHLVEIIPPDEINCIVFFYPLEGGGYAEPFTVDVPVNKTTIPWFNSQFPHCTWGDQNCVTVEHDGRTLDLKISFSPERETFVATPQRTHIEIFGERRRIAPDATKIPKSPFVH